jgi:hypothetical protein
LQRTLGNRAVGAFLDCQSAPKRPLIQAKLTVNAPGDNYKQKADRVAEQVMRMPVVQREEKMDRDRPDIMTLPDIQRDGDGASDVDDNFERQLETSRRQGQVLPCNIREEFESKFCADFSGVHIHTDTQSKMLNQSIQAKAFTTGQDIYFGSGQYTPCSIVGKRLLAHELLRNT